PDHLLSFSGNSQKWFFGSPHLESVFLQPSGYRLSSGHIWKKQQKNVHRERYSSCRTVERGNYAYLVISSEESAHAPGSYRDRGRNWRPYCNYPSRFLRYQ